MNASGMLKGYRISAAIAASKAVVIALAVMLSATSCRTTSRTTAVSSTAENVQRSDSTYVRETVKLDTVKISADSVSVELPKSWIFVQPDEWLSADASPEINTVTKKSGRATVTATRTNHGLVVTANCDSAWRIVASWTKLAYRLKTKLDSLSKVTSSTSESHTVVTRIPLWAILTLIISIAINALFIYLKLKP